jgi:hypothetical protein
MTGSNNPNDSADEPTLRQAERALHASGGRVGKKLSIDKKIITFANQKCTKCIITKLK